ncbi:MAG: hypothetical protein WA782_11545 [Sulfitobacter sp.]
MKNLRKISRLGHALQWFTVIWIVQLLLWSLWVSLFQAGGTDVLSFTTYFPLLLQKYGWIPFVAGLCLQGLCSPWMKAPTGRDPEPQPGGTY